MMGELLPEFEQQFAAVTADITSKTCRLLIQENLDRDEVIKHSREIENLIGDANELLERMELEVRDAPQDQREKLRGRVKSYEVELKRLELEYKRAVEKHTGPVSEGKLRQELFSGGTDSRGFSVGEEQRQRLLENTESLERSSLRLSQGYKAALESEQVGAQILNDLQYQRDTLGRARNRLRDTDDDLNQSSRVLNVMLKRVLQNKFIIGAVLVVVVIVIISAIAIKVSHLNNSG